MADAGPVVRVAVTPDLAGYVRLSAAMYWRHTGWVVCAGAVVLFLWAIVSLADYRGGPVPPLAGGCLLSSVALLVLLPFSLRRACRQRWERSPELRAERVYEFAADGVSLASALVAARVDWAVIRRAGVVAGNAVLFTGQGQVYYVPEAALSDEQRADLDELLRAHVPGFAGLPARG